MIIFFNLSGINAQQKLLQSEILSKEQVQTIFADSVRKEFKLNYPIFRVYKYSDKSGKYLCVLTESNDSIDNEKDTFNHSIKAVNLRIDNNKLEKTWEINDYILKNEKQENSIWFWTRYIEFKDFNNDSLIEPIIIYGTSGMNGYGDGRIKFIIYYNGNKIAIRQQNGVLDNQRNTQIDKEFFSLPQKLKDAVKAKTKLMVENNQAIFTETF